MVALNVVTSTWRRRTGGKPEFALINRYAETAPNKDAGGSLQIRPALKRWRELGNGPIRAIFNEPGSFENSLFVVSDDILYRLSTDGAFEVIGNITAGTGFPSMGITAAIGPGTPEFLWLADGSVLWLYAANGFATSTFEATATVVAGDVFQIGTVYYQITAGSVDAGTPAGTLANPWLVLLGADDRETFTNIGLALDATASGRGTIFSTSLLLENPDVTEQATTAATLIVRARVAGAGGNSIPVGYTGASGSWLGATLGGGQGAYFTRVDLPDGLSAISVGVIAGFVIVVQRSEAEGFNGRFFWIKPGATSIDPLDFATAEYAPDPLSSVRVSGDQFWLLGTKTIEPWYVTGELDLPFARVQGQLFDKGVLEGTDVRIKGTILIADADGVVYRFDGSAPVRVSDHGVEERIRQAIRDL